MPQNRLAFVNVDASRMLEPLIQQIPHLLESHVPLSRNLKDCSFRRNYSRGVLYALQALVQHFLVLLDRGWGALSDLFVGFVLELPAV